MQKIINYIILFLYLPYLKLCDNLLLPFYRFKFNQNKKKDVFPLVSIIIATYNRSNILINRTLPSILCQTYENFEVVIVGDKCIDNTALFFENYPDKRVRFFDLPKRGNYPLDIKDRWFVQGTTPRNKGMKLAKGEWFVFISDDDILMPNHIEVLLKNALRLNVEFISASYETYKNGNKIIVHPQQFIKGTKSAYIGGMQTWLYRSYLKCFKWNIHSWRKSWNRPVDYDLQLRFLNSGVRMGHINDIVYINPPVHGTNTTGYEGAILAENNN
jgi:glycosyltransferase involved in cell wall biosynthesis